MCSSDLFLRQVIDVDPNLIFAKDAEGRFTLVNQAVADAFGTTVENIIGKTDADFNPNAAEVAHFRHRDEQVMQTQRELLIPEEMLTTATGKVLWLQTVKRPLLDERGVATQILGSATDITERKRAEKDLRDRLMFQQDFNRFGRGPGRFAMNGRFNRGFERDYR